MYIVHVHGQCTCTLAIQYIHVHLQQYAKHVCQVTGTCRSGGGATVVLINLQELACCSTTDQTEGEPADTPPTALLCTTSLIPAMGTCTREVLYMYMYMGSLQLTKSIRCFQTVYEGGKQGKESLGIKPRSLALSCQCSNH